MHWILVYNALFFFDFLFNRIVPNLYISNAVLGPGGTSRTDFKSLRKTSDNYNGYDKYWFKFSK